MTYTEAEYKAAVKEMFEAARCALWHVTKHENYSPCPEDDRCPCKDAKDAMSVILSTYEGLLKEPFPTEEDEGYIVECLDDNTSLTLLPSGVAEIVVNGTIVARVIEA